MYIKSGVLVNHAARGQFVIDLSIKPPVLDQKLEVFPHLSKSPISRKASEHHRLSRPKYKIESLVEMAIVRSNPSS